VRESYVTGPLPSLHQTGLLGRGNGSVTSGIRANPDYDVSSSTSTSGVGRGPIYDEGVIGLGEEECYG